ncbi:polyubiquitin-like [Thrips palmi]|uniref:Polyubiquitin-like n=1 Tax=Thrips palmi TaxID=161013 RepID=A0A6P8ZCX8_THRPL|nr:polyubiquitin-like [Thrips palmi]
MRLGTAEKFGPDVRRRTGDSIPDQCPRICLVANNLLNLAVLVSPDGDFQLTLQVLCNDVPLRAVSLVDPATGLPNLRFVAPAPGGRLTMRLHNGGMEEGCTFKMQRAELAPTDSWEKGEAGVVNMVSVLYHLTSTTVLRDESTGGRAMLVESLRDAQGRAVGEEDAERLGLARTKWRLGLWPRKGAPRLDGCEWRLLGAQQGGEAPLFVRTPSGDAVVSACPTESIESLKATIEHELRIPRAEQRLRAADGACPEWVADVLAKGFPTLYVCGKLRLGTHLWLYVHHPKGTKFVVTKSTRTVQSVLRGVLGVPSELHGLYLDGRQLQGDRPLCHYNVACLDTLDLRECGSLRISVAVEGASAHSYYPETVEVGVDPEDTVAVLRKRAICRLTSQPWKQESLDRNDACALYSGDEELQRDCTLAECGIGTPSMKADLLVLRIPMPAPSSKVQLFVRTLLGETFELQCFDWNTTVEGPLSVQRSADGENSTLFALCDSYWFGAVKMDVMEKSGVPPDQQRLIWKGRQLEDCRSLRSLAMSKEELLHLALRLRGGGDEKLAVGKIVSGEVVPAPEASPCRFPADSTCGSPKLQFDVFVDEDLPSLP